MIEATNVLVVPDLHIRRKPGGQDRRSLDALKAYANDGVWSHVVFLGDILDHNSISSHNKGNLRAVSGETLLGDYETANLELDEIVAAARAKHVVLIEGNHDYRATRVVAEQPTLAGIVETQNGLRVAERGWRWVPYWSKGTTYEIGKASFGHGRYTGQHHAYKHGSRYARNFYYGHLHDVQEYTFERDGDNKQFESASIGCLCQLQQDYMKGAPTRWQQAFGVFRFRPDGFFNRYTVRLFGHRFISPEGREYRG